MKSFFSIGVFGIILNEKNHVLLCHRTDIDTWNLPGGGLHDLEAPVDGVIREVKEETGLEVKILRLCGVYTKTKKNELVFSFLCKQQGGAITLNAEADQIEYFDPMSLPTNIVEKQVVRIQHALEQEAMGAPTISYLRQ